jgi:hypothetical protein
MSNKKMGGCDQTELLPMPARENSIFLTGMAEPSRALKIPTHAFSKKYPDLVNAVE